jgi:hypothetical protein
MLPLREAHRGSRGAKVKTKKMLPLRLPFVIFCFLTFARASQEARVKKQKITRGGAGGSRARELKNKK